VCCVLLRSHPSLDPLYAREKVWLPFMARTLGCGADSIIVVSEMGVGVVGTA
jgi:hypothetical protein